MEQGYRMVFKEKRFLQNTAANFINRLGDSIDMIAFSWMVFEITGSPSWSAIILGINMLPNIFIQPFAGAFIDRLHKKRVMIICDLARGGLTFLIFALYVTDILNPWMLVIITFLNSSFESFRTPAGLAFLPSILKKEHYDYALSFSQTSSRICELIGVGISGIVIATIGIAGAIVIDSLSFVISAFIIWSIQCEKEVLEKTKLVAKVYFDTLKEGFVYVKQTKLLWMLCMYGALINVVLVPFNSFEAAYINGVLHQDATLLSTVNISMSIGMALGSFSYPILHKKITHRWMLVIGGITTGLYYASAYGISFLTETSMIYLTLCCIGFAFGWGIALIMSVVQINMMKLVPTTHIARVSSIFNASGTAAMPVASFLMSALCVSVSVLEIYLYFAVFTILVFVGMIFVKELKKL